MNLKASLLCSIFALCSQVSLAQTMTPPSTPPSSPPPMTLPNQVGTIRNTPNEMRSNTSTVSTGSPDQTMNRPDDDSPVPVSPSTIQDVDGTLKIIDSNKPNQAQIPKPPTTPPGNINRDDSTALVPGGNVANPSGPQQTIVAPATGTAPGQLPALPNQLPGNLPAPNNQPPMTNQPVEDQPPPAGATSGSIPPVPGMSNPPVHNTTPAPTGVLPSPETIPNSPNQNQPNQTQTNTAGTPTY